MFGMGGSEIIVILIVALLFLGPDKLPQAAKSISKGIRDIKKQSRLLQQQIESDEQIGGAIRDIKSALRGEEAPIRPKPFVAKPPQLTEGAAAAGAAVAATAEAAPATESEAAAHAGEPAAAAEPAVAHAAATHAKPATAHAAEPVPTLTLPPTAGEPDPTSGPASETAVSDLASLIKPASGTVAKGS